MCVVVLFGGYWDGVKKWHAVTASCDSAGDVFLFLRRNLHIHAEAADVF